MESLLRSWVFRAGLPGVVVLFAAAVPAPEAYAYNGLNTCIGSKAAVISCCETTRKPPWWWEISASCRSQLSCYPVKAANGKKTEECRIRRKDGGLPDF